MASPGRLAQAMGPAELWRGAARLLAAALVALALAAAPAAAERGNGLTVRLAAEWPTHVLAPLMEASEYLGAGRFWDFVNAICDAPAPAETRAEALDLATQIAATTIDGVSPLGSKLLKLSAELRAFAPAVEQQRQLALALWSSCPQASAGAAMPRTWVAIFSGGEVSLRCETDPNAVRKALSAGSSDGSAQSSASDLIGSLQLLESDHIHPRSNRRAAAPGTGVTAILHGVLGTPEFVRLHQLLAGQVEATPDMTYVIRFAPTVDDPQVTPLAGLQGYGVYLDIKNMEYITVDDQGKGSDGAVSGEPQEDSTGPVDRSAEVKGIRFDSLIDALPEAEEVLATLHTELLEESEQEAGKSNEIEQIKVWDMARLGVQAVTQIFASSDPLARWLDIVENFPLRAKALLRVRPNATITKAAAQSKSSNLQGVEDGIITVNGISFDVGDESFNLFAMLHTLAKESELAASAGQIALPGNTPVSQITLETAMRFSSGEYTSNDNTEDEAISALRSLGTRVDLRKGAKGAVIFLNNIEKDRTYANWPETLQVLLQQAYQLIPVRKNLYTSIVVLDLSQAADRQVLDTLFLFIEKGAPIRFGVTFLPAEGAEQQDKCNTECILSLFVQATEVSGRDVANRLLRELVRQPEGLPSVDEAKALYVQTSMQLTKRSRAKPSEEYQAAAVSALAERKGAATAKAMASYTVARGITSSAWSLNGLLFAGLESLPNDLSQYVFREQRVMAYLVHFRKIDTKTDVLKFILSAVNAIPRFNAEVLKSTSDSQFAMLDSAQDAFESIQYLVDATASEQASLPPVTAWFLATRKSFSPGHTGPLANFLRFLQDEPAGVRGAVLPGDGTHEVCGKFWELVLSKAPVADMIALLEGSGGCTDTSPDDATSTQVRSLAVGIAPVLEKAGVSTQSVMVNGRVVPANAATIMNEDDYVLLADYERRARGFHLSEVLRKHDFAAVTADQFMQLSALAGIQSRTPREELPIERFESLSPLVLNAAPVETLAGEFSELKQPALVARAIINPLAKTAPMVASVLRLLRDALGVSVQALLLPDPAISSFPIATFFRFVAEQNEESVEPAASFRGMPQEQLLTLKISTPEPWIVYPSDTDGLDTDNIRFGHESGDREVAFELQSLLVTGHCQDGATHTPPAGLQLQLLDQNGGSQQSPVVSDTLVMRNLGYWQLQARPGVWALDIAPGRSQDIYSLESSASLDGASSSWRAALMKRKTSLAANDQGGVALIVRDFVGHVEQVVVRKRPGHEADELLDGLEESSSEAAASQQPPAAAQPQEANEPSGIFGWIRSIFSSAPAPAAAPSSSKETLHVFSLASGALYERFLRIMMVSVRKKTSNPVKFWLIENFLSPDFKSSIATLAAHYKFEYALVTYKWPQWLRRQTEKQRIIWGYKILFLDVLFPLNVPKIIYIDSDQVVRADIKELWDLDLKGKPYGYTPFCTSREETLGFQFWRQGYWHDHLRGKPYHISALYVVDLVRFRRMMVGDKLRAIYDQLSRDPNSLANLDQDLPNYAQNMVPIHSLPQEWLWCESWCSDASKERAKTIDLCNNPLHKEPKLDMAKRVISGELFEQSWTELDEEIKAVIGGQCVVGECSSKQEPAPTEKDEGDEHAGL